MDTARVAAIAAGLTPLALEQPASAYDSVVAMLQSHLEVRDLMRLRGTFGDLHGHNHSDIVITSIRNHGHNMS